MLEALVVLLRAREMFSTYMSRLVWISNKTSRVSVRRVAWEARSSWPSRREMILRGAS